MIISKKMEENVMDQSRTIVNQLSMNVQTVLGNYGRSLQMVAQSDEIENYFRNSSTLFDEADGLLREDFKTFLSSFTNTSGIYTADAEGILYEPHFDGIKDVDAQTRPWYNLGISNPDVVSWTEPYLDTATGEFTITGVTGVRAGNRVVGVLAADILLTNLTEMVAAAELGYNGFGMILDRTGKAIAHPNRAGEDLSGETYIQNLVQSDGSQTLKESINRKKMLKRMRNDLKIFIKKDQEQLQCNLKNLSS